MHRARASTKTAVVVIDTDPLRSTSDGGWWWEVGVPEVSDSTSVVQARAAYEAGKRQPVTSDDVNAHLREITGREVTAKDFRTWGGTMHAAIALQSMGTPASRREADRNIISAVDAVAERLGNTRAVCRKYYVHPALIEAYRMGRTVPLPQGNVPRYLRRQRESALRRDEVAVLQFLQDALDA